MSIDITAVVNTSEAAARRLRAVPDAEAAVASQRPILMRLCAGEPTVLTKDEVNMLELSNDATTSDLTLLDEDTDPDDVHPAEYVLEHFVATYGQNRQANGDRVQAITSQHGRYVIPFLVELAFRLPAAKRGMSSLRLNHVEKLPQILAGDAVLPAAVVAAGILKSNGGPNVAIQCLHLALDHAAVVTCGGADGLSSAIDSGQLATYADTRTGELLVRPYDLRAAGLLMEPERPHGLKKNSATNVLRDMRLAFERAQAHGVNNRVTFKLKAIDPLTANRMNDERETREYVGLAEIAITAAKMPPIGQVNLWLERVLGLRISEAYGPEVRDYTKDADGRGWIVIEAQGGHRSFTRDPETGRLVAGDRKARTKSRAGVRTIPLPAQLTEALDALIDTFHTNPETGAVDLDARLIPGLREDDISGQATYRDQLHAAQKGNKTAFLPHTMRACLITDLKNAGISERIRHAYAGHEMENQTIQDQHYDLGVPEADLVTAADVLERLIAEEVPNGRLIAATTKRHIFGVATKMRVRKVWIETRLRTHGWSGVADASQVELSVDAVAARIGKARTTTGRLMTSQTIPSHTKSWGQREVRVAYERDVEAYLDSLGTDLSALAGELGCGYRRVYDLAGELGLLDNDRDAKARILLTDSAADAVRDAVLTRAEAEQQAVPLALAADMIGLELNDVQTLVLQDVLRTVNVPGAKRLRYVTVDSIDSYNARHPRVPTLDARDEPTGAFMATAKLMGISRATLGVLVRTRRVQATTRGRQQRIVLSSALAWAEAIGKLELVDVLKEELER